MSLYTVHIADVNYRPQSRSDLPRLPLIVTVLFYAKVRELPGYGDPLKETYVVESREDLSEKALAKWAELERKGEFCLTLKDALTGGMVDITPAKPDEENNLTQDTSDTSLSCTESLADTVSPEAPA